MRPLTLTLTLTLTAACDQGGTKTMDMAGEPDQAVVSTIPFDFETVDAMANGSNIALLIDGSGGQHVFYVQSAPQKDCMLGGIATKYTPSQLFHASRASAQGPFGKLAVSGTDVEPAGISAALDPKTGRPVVSYQGGQPGSQFCGGSDMILARYTGSAWNRTTVADKSTAGVGPVETSGDVVGVTSALSITKGGTWYLAWQDVHFGYYMFDDLRKADLEFAYGPDAAFKLGEGVAQDGAGKFNTMALDSMDRPIIAYSDYRVGGLTVALRQVAGMPWKIARLTDSGDTPPCIASDAKSGKIGVAYYDDALKVLRLRESPDGVTWGPADIVDQSGDVGRTVNLRYDGMGRPVLSYWRCGDYKGCDPTKDALMFARREGPDTWRYGVVDTGGDGACGSVLALAIDMVGASNKGYIAYQCNPFDQASGQFKAIVRLAHEK